MFCERECPETFAETVTDLHRTRRGCCWVRGVDVAPLDDLFVQLGTGLCSQFLYES